MGSASSKVIILGKKYKKRATISVLFYFGHQFYTDANFFPLCLLMYIFPVLFKDTTIDLIYGHVKPCHSGHYGHFVNIGHYGLIKYGPEYNQYWCLCEEKEKYGSPVKVEWKKMQWLKSYGQNKIKFEIMAISFVFWARK